MPNLLYIHSDQHNASVLGCAGDGVVRTPHLDRLAARGVIFDSVYCCSPICVPSRMSALTGLHPHRNRVWTNEHCLDSGLPTLAHSMGAAGYDPVLVGRMHSIGPDQLHGYTERLVGDHSPNFLGGKGPARGYLEGTAGPFRVSVERSGAGQHAYEIHDEEVAAAAVDFLNRIGIRKRAGLHDRPFSLSVGFMLPHPPYVVRKREYDLYRDTVSMPRHAEPGDEADHPFYRWWRGYTGIENPATEEETRRSRSAYWGMVTRMDAMIGDILLALERNGLADDTLVVYTSDHGDMLGERGLWWKHVFFEDSVRVPLIVSWPGRLPAGERCGRVVSSLDVTATMLDALDAPALPESSGRSLVPLLNDRTTPWDDSAFSEYCSDEYAPPGGVYHRMVRRGKYKLCCYHDETPLLFDLENDPDERRNLAGDRSHAAVRDELVSLVLDGWDPEAVKQEMAIMKSRNDIIRDWVKKTDPAESIRWEMKEEMNYLDVRKG